MHTTQLLAEALRKADLPEMADTAETGYYHDFLSPLAMPCIQLAADLAKVGTPTALAVRARHLNGEFDATREESDAWISSPDGQETLGMLMPKSGRVGK